MSDPQGILGDMIQKMQPSAPPEEKQEENNPDMTDKIVWEPAKAAEDYDIRLAEGSIRPMSEAALRQQVIELKKAGMIDVAHALEILDIPDWEEIAEAVQREMELAALAKVGRK
jgi:hypothetical protein